MRSSPLYPVERALFRGLVRTILAGCVRVEGLENIPPTGPVIVVGNHIATVDPPLVGARIPRDDVFAMAKAEAFRRRFARFLLYGWNAFPVRRGTADRVALSHSLRVLDEGHVLLMFPEGSRADDRALHRAFPGVGFLALRSGAPVVCVAVTGTEGVLPKGAWVPHRARVTIRCGAPIHLERHRPDGRRVSNQEAADVIMAALSALLPERYRGVYAASREPGDGPDRAPAA